MPWVVSTGGELRDTFGAVITPHRILASVARVLDTDPSRVSVSVHTNIREITPQGFVFVKIEALTDNEKVAVTDYMEDRLVPDKYGFVVQRRGV